MESVVSLLKAAKSVHADMSEYNCLMVDGVPRLIDCGQAVLTSHPMAREFMERDIKNLARYFARRAHGVDAAAMVELGTRLLSKFVPDDEDVADEEAF